MSRANVARRTCNRTRLFTVRVLLRRSCGTSGLCPLSVRAAAHVDGSSPRRRRCASDAPAPRQRAPLAVAMILGADGRRRRAPPLSEHCARIQAATRQPMRSVRSLHASRERRLRACVRGAEQPRANRSYARKPRRTRRSSDPLPFIGPEIVSARSRGDFIIPRPSELHPDSIATIGRDNGAPVQIGPSRRRSAGQSPPIEQGSWGPRV